MDKQTHNLAFDFRWISDKKIISKYNLQCSQVDIIVDLVWFKNSRV